MKPHSSNEIESRIFSFKVSMDYRRFLVSASSFSNESSQSVSIPDAWGFLDCPRDIVVCVAEFVGQELNLVWRFPNGIMNHSVSGRSGHALLSSSGNQVELIHISVSDGGIYDCPREWILEWAYVSTEDSCVDSLANIDIHELSLRNSKIWEGWLDLVYFWFADTLNLSLSHTISVEDDSFWECPPIVLLERLTSLCHPFLKRVSWFLAKFALNDACWPVLCCSGIHWCGEGKNWLLTKTSGMEHVHSADHCRSTHQGQIVNSPGNTSDLGINLDQDLVHNWPQIFALLDGPGQYCLAGHRDISQEEFLDVIIERTSSLLPR